APLRWLKKVEFKARTVPSKITSEAVSGTLADAGGVRLSQTYVEVSISGDVHADALPFFLIPLAGGVQSSAGPGSSRVHAIEPVEDIACPVLTVWRHEPGVGIVRFAGCVVASLELTQASDGYFSFSATLVGREGAPHSPESGPSTQDEHDFVARDVTVRM